MSGAIASEVNVHPARVDAESISTPLAETRCITDLASLEAEMASGLGEAWTTLVDHDPRASVFQAPGWCLPWYRCYADEFDPFLVLVEGANRLAGVVPMAVRRATRELIFASGNMADYRDIVALPHCRQAVVSALVDRYLAGRFPGPLEIGWIDPSSDTPALVAEECRKRGLGCAERYQPCWRWFPVEGEDLKKKFSRVRTHLNHFKRSGEVAFDLVEDPAGWSRFREEFFAQHSLRQLQAGRAVSFDDDRKRRLYDALVASPAIHTHVTAFRVDGRLMSGHVGLVWRNVLQLGAPSICIEAERRSPAVILMTWIIQHAAELGLHGFDLTIGEGEFKKRLGNRLVRLTTVEVYGRRRDYLARVARSKVVALTRKTVERVAGEGAWTSRLKPLAESMNASRRTIANEGVARTVRSAIDAVVRRPRHVLYSISSDAFLETSEDSARPLAVHENRIEDLLASGDESARSRNAIHECAASYARARETGHTLHTVMDNGVLAGWAFSEPALAYGFQGLPRLTEQVFNVLLARVVKAARERGDTRVSVRIDAREKMLKPVLERTGFRITEEE